MNEKVIITERAIEVIFISWNMCACVCVMCMHVYRSVCRCIHKIINYWLNSMKLLVYTKKRCASLFSLNWLLVLSIHFTVSHNIDSHGGIKLHRCSFCFSRLFKFQVPLWKYQISFHSMVFVCDCIPILNFPISDYKTSVLLFLCNLIWSNSLFELMTTLK